MITILIIITLKAYSYLGKSVDQCILHFASFSQVVLTGLWPAMTVSLPNIYTDKIFSSGWMLWDDKKIGYLITDKTCLKR